MKREERRAAAREGILAAAHRLVAEEGCGAASIVAVAGRAGVASGSLYRHFPSRAELLAEVVGDALRGEHLLVTRAAEGLPPREGLVAWVRVSVERALTAPVLMHALLAEPADPAVDAVRRRERAAREASLAALLEGGAAAGTWPRAGGVARSRAGGAAQAPALTGTGAAQAPTLAVAQAAAITGALEASLVGPAAQERLGPHPDPRAVAAQLTTFVLGAIAAR